MSMPTASTQADPLKATQQQLDELDALIERMLTLPVNQLEDDAPLELPPIPPLSEPALPATTAYDRAPAFAVSSASRRGDSWKAVETAFAQVERDEPFARDEEPAWRDEPAIRPAAPIFRRSEMFPETAPASRPLPAVKVETHTAAPLQGMPAAPGPRTAWWLRLLLRTNRNFDRCMRWCGSPGQQLRTARGRSYLGGIGMILLAAALVWGILDYLGWNW